MRMSNIALVALHIVCWLLNYWFIVFGSEFNWNGFSHADESLGRAYAYGLFFNAFLFYTQVFYLYPKVYQHKKKFNFYLFTFVAIVAITIIETYCDAMVYEHYAIEKPYLCGFITNMMVHVAYVVAGFYFALKIAFKKAEKLKQKLLEESYKTELKYLKAQLNPHFLFNGINSVYHLIGKNNDLAKETLHQFSDLLRYQLYESNTHILLEKELDYISKYIKIEETRKGADIQLEYAITLENPRLKIAPLLLIPFIENAFKHCSNHIESSENTIAIKIEEFGGELSLAVVNTYDEISYKNEVGGIGLENVKKRLSLLYPGQYTLLIKTENSKHSVTLNLSL